MSVYFISGRTKDSIHLVHNNYRFSKDRTRNGTVYWRCILSRRTPLNPDTCRSRISTDNEGNVLHFGQHLHNHPPEIETEIRIRKCISDIKRVAELDKSNSSTRVLVDNIVAGLPDDVRCRLPSAKALEKCAQRSKRRSITQGPTQVTLRGPHVYRQLNRDVPRFPLAFSSSTINLTSSLQNCIRIEIPQQTFSLAVLSTSQESITQCKSETDGAPSESRPLISLSSKLLDQLRQQLDPQSQHVPNNQTFGVTPEIMQLLEQNTAQLLEQNTAQLIGQNISPAQIFEQNPDQLFEQNPAQFKIEENQAQFKIEQNDSTLEGSMEHGGSLSLKDGGLGEFSVPELTAVEMNKITEKLLAGLSSDGRLGSDAIELIQSIFQA